MGPRRGCLIRSRDEIGAGELAANESLSIDLARRSDARSLPKKTFVVMGDEFGRTLKDFDFGVTVFRWRLRAFTATLARGH